MLARLSLAILVLFAALAIYWLFLSQPAGLPLPRQIVLGLGFGSAFVVYGCGIGHRRGKLQVDGKINHGFMTKLLAASLSLGMALLAVAMPTLYLLVSYAIEGTLVSAPEVEARLPSGYSGS